MYHLIEEVTIFRESALSDHMKEKNTDIPREAFTQAMDYSIILNNLHICMTAGNE